MYHLLESFEIQTIIDHLEKEDDDSLRYQRHLHIITIFEFIIVLCIH